MQLVKPIYEIWEQETPEKQIERAGRVCYKSEDKIAEGTDKVFVDRMIANKHYAMLEHGTIYMHIETDGEDYSVFNSFVSKYRSNKYSRVYFKEEFCGLLKITHAYVTTNMRVLVENGWLSDRNYECEPLAFHEKRMTVHFTLDMGVGREFTRHRVFSFAQESTRYCNYAKDKFGGEVSFMIPEWIKNYVKLTDKAKYEFKEALEDAEKHYLNLISYGCTPQEARCVLPLATKSELVMTGFESDWKHFFDLRAIGTTGAPHPDAKAIAEPLMKEMNIL